MVCAWAAAAGTNAAKPVIRPTAAAGSDRSHTDLPCSVPGTIRTRPAIRSLVSSRCARDVQAPASSASHRAGYRADVKLEPQSRPRRITLERAFNFRDLGGYAAADGRTVRWGLLYRADGIHRIEGADLARVVRTRDPHGARSAHTWRARRSRPRCRRSRSTRSYHHLPLLEQVWERDLPVAELDAVEFLAGRYFEMLDLGRELDRHRARRRSRQRIACRSCSTARPERIARVCSRRSCSACSA